MTNANAHTPQTKLHRQMVDRHYPKLHVKLVLSTASSVDVHQQTATASIERMRRLALFTLLYYGCQSRVIGYQALLFASMKTGRSLGDEVPVTTATISLHKMIAAQIDCYLAIHTTV